MKARLVDFQPEYKREQQVVLETEIGCLHVELSNEDIERLYRDTLAELTRHAVTVVVMTSPIMPLPPGAEIRRSPFTLLDLQHALESAEKESVNEQTGPS